ncbi:hypothetical protein BH10PSE3_BH10PSE3_28430 [soil metagenome]
MLPPPVIDAARVVAFATIGLERAFNAEKLLFVGGVQLGRVPGLAIVEGLDDKDFLILFCDEQWQSVGIVEAKSIADAKDRASAFYPDIRDVWQTPTYGPADVEKFIEENYGVFRCSFCGKLPFQFTALFEAESARICDACVRQYRDQLDT